MRAICLPSGDNASDPLAGLWFYWLSTGHGAEARGWTLRYLASSREEVHPLQRFQGDLAAAQILRFAGDPDAGAALDRELVATARAHPKAVVHGIVVEATAGRHSKRPPPNLKPAVFLRRKPSPRRL